MEVRKPRAAAIDPAHGGINQSRDDEGEKDAQESKGSQAQRQPYQKAPAMIVELFRGS